MTAIAKSTAPKKPSLPTSAAGKKKAAATPATAKPKAPIAKPKKSSAPKAAKAAKAAAAVEAVEAAENDDDPATTRAVDESKRRKKAKLVGYRRLAKDCGYNHGADGDPNSAAGLDGGCCLITLSDAKRLTRFIPASPDKVSFSEEEFEQRQTLNAMGVTSAAARETQVRCDYALKQILNRAAVRCGETNTKQITAATIQSVLRPYVGKMQFTAIVPPLGLVREAQREGVLDYPDVDKTKADAEKEACKRIKEMHAQWLTSEAKKKSLLGKKVITKGKA